MKVLSSLSNRSLELRWSYFTFKNVTINIRKGSKTMLPIIKSARTDINSRCTSTERIQGVSNLALLPNWPDYALNTCKQKSVELNTLLNHEISRNSIYLKIILFCNFLSVAYVTLELGLRFSLNLNFSRGYWVSAFNVRNFELYYYLVFYNILKLEFSCLQYCFVYRTRY